MAKAPTPKRGEIWLVDFDPAVGAEIRKLRPALVMSLNAVGRLPLRLVVPITDWKPHYVSLPWMAAIPASSTNRLTKDSAADAFQTKSVSLGRFSRKLGKVSDAELEQVASAIALCVGAP
jgi:mRNA interferase MazF